MKDGEKEKRIPDAAEERGKGKKAVTILHSTTPTIYMRWSLIRLLIVHSPSERIVGTVDLQGCTVVTDLVAEVVLSE